MCVVFAHLHHSVKILFGAILAFRDMFYQLVFLLSYLSHFISVNQLAKAVEFDVVWLLS